MTTHEIELDITCDGLDEFIQFHRLETCVNSFDTNRKAIYGPVKHVWLIDESQPVVVKVWDASKYNVDSTIVIIGLYQNGKEIMYFHPPQNKKIYDLLSAYFPHAEELYVLK